MEWRGFQEEWEHVIACDLRAVFFLSQMVCKQMVGQHQRGGSIVNISSVHSLACLPGAGPVTRVHVAAMLAGGSDASSCRLQISSHS